MHFRLRRLFLTDYPSAGVTEPEGTTQLPRHTYRSIDLGVPREVGAFTHEHEYAHASGSVDFFPFSNFCCCCCCFMSLEVKDFDSFCLPLSIPRFPSVLQQQLLFEYLAFFLNRRAPFKKELHRLLPPTTKQRSAAPLSVREREFSPIPFSLSSPSLQSNCKREN